MHILIVDDSRSISLPVIAFLEQHGNRVTYAQNGQEAVEAYRREEPSLILMDIIMPVMDGIEATRRIKAMSKARWVPILLMSGLSEKKDVIHGLDAGADDYLVKPIDFDVLEARLGSFHRITLIQDSLFSVLDNVYEAILTINEQGMVQSYNRAAERIFGYVADEVIGQNVNMLMPSPYRDEHDDYLGRYLKERIPHVIGIGRKVAGLRKNGQTFPMRLSVTEVRRNNESLFIGLVSDITEEEIARQHIEFLALHDPLTGLPNRTHFNQTLDTVFLNRGDSRFALLFIDLDGFKLINDAMGHDAGDTALKAAASRLRHSLAADDFIARLGGDEFVAIIRNVADADVVLIIANRILESVSQPMELLGKPASMGASIGVAMVPQHGTVASEVLSAADNAMYVAKGSGKGRVVLVGSTT